MSRMMRNDDVIGGTSNNSRQILYEPSGRAQTNVSDELDKVNTDISTINTHLSETVGTESVCGTYNGQPLYRKAYHGTGIFSSNITLDTTINSSNVTIIEINEVYKIGTTYTGRSDAFNGGVRLYTCAAITNASVIVQSNEPFNEYTVEIKYIKNN